MSQVKGAIVLQSPPEGQQTTDNPLLNSMQSEPVGQQKLDGRPGWLQDWELGAPQVFVALDVKSKFGSLSTEVERAVTATTMEIRYTAVSCREVLLPIKSFNFRFLVFGCVVIW